MLQRDYFATLGRYHVWADRKLLESLAPISDVDYHSDQGLFFRSIHRTLNHLLLVDLLWHGRLTGSPFAVSGLDQELVKERGRLEEELLRQAGVLRDLTAGLDEARIGKINTYFDTEGNRRESPLALQLGHAFNHATHHRGQVTAVITRLGLEAPVLDLPYFVAEQSG
ncbi:MAG: DinB family protein [Gammaproteobacteria bacterium]